MNKKGNLTIDVIILLAIGLIIVIVVGVTLIPKIGKSSDVIQFGNFDDYDNDKVANFFDSCPCSPTGTYEHATLEGCPRDKTEQQSQDEKKLFKENECLEQAPMAGEQESTNMLLFFEGDAAVSSGYTTNANFISYKATCASQCTVLVKQPDDEFAPWADLASDMPLEEDLELPFPGSYFVILSERGQEKIQFRINRE